MNRREALQQVAWLMGGAVSAPAILGVLNGCTAKVDAGFRPVFLTEEQAAIVAEIAEIMIPRTATPSAKDVGVPQFIDTMLKDAYPRDDQQRYQDGLEAFDARAREIHQRGFLLLDAAQRARFVQTVHDEAIAAESKLHVPLPKLRRPFILMTKELSMLGFFTSQPGATQVLQYVAVPGAFRACVPLSVAGNGKTWGTETIGRF